MVTKDKIRLQELSHKSLMGTITDAEKKELGDWLNQVEEKPLEIPDDIAEDKSQYGEYLFQRISEQTGIKPEPQTTILWPKIVAIAAAVAFMVLGVYFFNYRNSAKNDQNNGIVMQDIAPGKQGATLTLANGKTIRLSDVKNGELAKQAGITITKTKEGQLIYEIKPSAGTTTDFGGINTLSTAKGETYKVNLPDGTEVWLNAASSLKYAANLLQYGKRKVSLQGEAYFQVAKDKAHPFVVETEKQLVEVLGTHFNINAYSDEKVVKTTLLEGSVKIASLSGDKTKSSILKPGQQSVLNEKGIQVTEVEPDEAIAWQKGYFRFYDEHIVSVMSKISRWYNIEVEYESQLPQVGFNARIDKYSNMKDVLKILEKSKAVHFKIEGRKVIVSK